MASELEKAALRVIQAWDKDYLGEMFDETPDIVPAIDGLRIALRLTEEPPTHCPIHMFAAWVSGKCQTCTGGERS